MKLLSFRINNKDSYGVLDNDNVKDVGAVLGTKHPTLVAAFAKQALDEIKKVAAQAKTPSHPLSKIEFLPPLPDTGKLICVGKNYLDHVLEREQTPLEFPNLFLKARSSVVGHNHAIVRPKASEQFDYEGEFCMVIGKPGRHIKREDAMSHVAGFTIVQDGTLRDYQKRALMIGKNFQQSSSCGPWIVTADEIKDPNTLMLETRLNGKVMQHSEVGKVIFDFPYLISYLSEAFDLIPGDMISVGTPAGVGASRKPPVWMKAGDVLEVEIENIGTLRNTVINEA